MINFEKKNIKAWVWSDFGKIEHTHKIQFVYTSSWKRTVINVCKNKEINSYCFKDYTDNDN